MPSGSPRVEVGIRPPEALEALVAVLLGADGVLDDLHLGVDPDVAPHAHDGLRHGLVVGGVARGRLDDDLLVLVAGLLQALPRLLGVVGKRRERGVEVVVALGDGPAGHDAAPPPQLLDDEVAVDAEGEGLLDQGIVERGHLAVHGQDVEAGVERAGHPRGGIARDLLPVVGGQLGDDVDLALEEGGDAWGHLGDGPHHHPVEVGLAAPVVGAGLEHDLVVLGP